MKCSIPSCGKEVSAACSGSPNLGYGNEWFCQIHCGCPPRLCDWPGCCIQADPECERQGGLRRCKRHCEKDRGTTCRYFGELRSRCGKPLAEKCPDRMMCEEHCEHVRSAKAALRIEELDTLKRGEQLLKRMSPWFSSQEVITTVQDLVAEMKMDRVRLESQAATIRAAQEKEAELLKEQKMLGERINNQAELITSLRKQLDEAVNYHGGYLRTTLSITQTDLESMLHRVKKALR